MVKRIQLLIIYCLIFLLLCTWGFIFTQKSLAQNNCQSNDRNQGLISGLSVTGTFGNTNAQCVLDTKATYAVFGVPTFDSLKSTLYDQNSTSKATKALITCAAPSVTLNNTNLTPQNSNLLVYINNTCDQTRIDSSFTLGSSSKHVVIFAEKDVYIDSDINQTGVKYDGVMIITKGNIYIKSTVKTINAVLTAEGSIYTAYTTSIPPLAGYITAEQLVVNGSLISLNHDSTQRIHFKRALPGADNTIPAEKINFQPKYLIILRGMITQPFIIQREISPEEIPAALPSPTGLP